MAYKWHKFISHSFDIWKSKINVSTWSTTWLFKLQTSHCILTSQKGLGNSMGPLLMGTNLNHAAAAKSLQSCLTLCDPIGGSPPGSPVPGILQARTLEWVAISFSNAWKWKVKVKSLSHVRLLATPWTVAYQAPPSMGFFQARVLEWDAIAYSESQSWGSP